jgi:hypothetical protein
MWRTGGSGVGHFELNWALAVQALKTCLNYLSETNGEMHFFLHQVRAGLVYAATLVSARAHETLQGHPKTIP